MNIASSWGVDSADGTFLMHEFAKAIGEIESQNPPKTGESSTDYAKRIKDIFHQRGGDLSEATIVENFVHNVVDKQLNNPVNLRYKQIAKMMADYKRPIDKHMIWQNRGLTELNDFEPDQEVVDIDESGTVKTDQYGRPTMNRDVFDAMNSGYYQRQPPPALPTEQSTDLITRWRQTGVMPR